MRKPIQGKHLAEGCKTVDRRTGEETPSTGSMMLMPARKGTCEECAVAHDPTHPHNAQSMFYQYRFYNEHGRWPNWLDAMAHCSDEMRERWTAGIEAQGVNVKAGEVNPRRKK